MCFPFKKSASSTSRLRLIEYLKRSSHLSYHTKRRRGRDRNTYSHARVCVCVCVCVCIALVNTGAQFVFVVMFLSSFRRAIVSHRSLCFCNCLNFPFFLLSLLRALFVVFCVVSRVSSQLLLTRANSALSVFLYEQRRRTFCPRVLGFERESN